MRIENREVYYLGGSRLVTKTSGTLRLLRLVRLVRVILGDGALDTAMVSGTSAALVHVDDSLPSNLK